jgi:NTE family protein
MVKRFLKQKNYMESILNKLMLFLKIFIGSIFIFTVLHLTGVAHISKPLLITSGLLFGGIIMAGFLIAGLLYFKSAKYLGLFVKSRFGICTGNFFSSWMKDILNFNGIATTVDLENSMKEHQELVRLRSERQVENHQQDHKPVAGANIILIASDITNQRKVEFPAMAKYYWDKPEEASPADFVRASMAIPIFFEPFIRQVTRPPQTEEEKLILQNIPSHAGPENPVEVRFVDGGILSNFPINVFHNPNIPIARLPTFGVKLEDEDHEDPAKPASLKKTLFTYLGNIFSTIRFYYDRDFLLKNQLYQRTIGHVDVSGFNWLNFFLSDAEKVAMFKKGAEAAEIFFTGGTVWVDGKPRAFEAYNWETYKQMRAEVVKVERKEAENSLL